VIDVIACDADHKADHNADHKGPITITFEKNKCFQSMVGRAESSYELKVGYMVINSPM
jgi:hypothetical protein